MVGKTVDSGQLSEKAREILKTAENEQDLRDFFSIPDVPLEYLRFVKPKEGTWRPAVGLFEGWPDNLAGRYTLVATNVPYLGRGKAGRCAQRAP